MTRASASAIAAARRAIAVDMRARGCTWAAIGRHLGVTPGRAYAIATPVKRHGRKSKPYEWWPGTLAEYIAMRVRRVNEGLAALGAIN